MLRAMFGLEITSNPCEVIMKPACACHRLVMCFWYRSIMVIQRFSITVLLAIAASPVWGARPFVTDDARLTTDGSCQLETWTRIYRDSTEFWALPACNPGGNLELTLGAGRAIYDEPGRSPNSDYVFQAKTLLRRLTPNDVGIGIAAGTVRHPAVNPGPNLLGNTYVYLPLSVSLADDALVVHVNAGWLRETRTHRHLTTWGVGTEWNVSERITWMAETFGDSHPNTYWQAGGRFSLIPQRLQVDATIGQNAGGMQASRWVSFGLRITPASLF